MLHAGQSQLIYPRNVFCGWKPLLVFQNGYKKLHTQVDDTIKGSGREKGGHDWQQGEEELNGVIEKFTNIGDLILEPFAGSGTTIVAALKNKRRVIAAEIDENTYNISKAKVSQNQFNNGLF